MAKEKLIAMVKDSAFLEVHPTCVKAHEAVGWKVAEDLTQIPAPIEIQADPPAKKQTPPAAESQVKQTAGNDGGAAAGSQQAGNSDGKQE